ncbi:MAG: hypothetical protein E6J91_41275 [Deltaproteobacteria bacterium]|nr:MAG: hypothetical protein E6J91_41275 [Deltaproteobacteria bacterium]
MKHLLAVVVVSIVSLLGGGACNKPSADDCEKAIRNMQQLLGTGDAISTADLQGEIRRCQGGSNREAVACAAKATNPDELKACAFMAPKKSAP